MDSPSARAPAACPGRFGSVPGAALHRFGPGASARVPAASSAGRDGQNFPATLLQIDYASALKWRNAGQMPPLGFPAHVDR
jgi:hypothetical protein